MRTETDQELLDSYVASGDESAFAELAARYGPMAYRTCRRLLGNDHDAEDATQAAFLVLARKAGQLRRKGRMNGWLHRVARLTALQLLQKRARREQQAAQVAFWQENLPEDVSEMDREALLRHVDAELDGLSGALREAVVLRYLRGFGEREAAVQAGCAVGAMKWRASEGLAQLRKRLAKRGVALGASALAASLAREASAAVPETLLPSLLATVQSVAPVAGAAAGASTTATMLAEGAMKAMFWNGVRTACWMAASAGVVAVGGVAAVQVATEKPVPEPAALVREAGEACPAAQTMVAEARLVPYAIRDLHRRGVRMFVPGGVPPARQRIPPSLRGMETTVRDYVEQMATHLGYRAVWKRGNSVVVLEKPADDAERARLRRAFASMERSGDRRFFALAWQSRTVESIELLSRAVRSEDPAIAAVALEQLGSFSGFAGIVACALDETLWPLIWEDIFRSPSFYLRRLEAAGEIAMAAPSEAWSNLLEMAEHMVRYLEGADASSHPSEPPMPLIVLGMLPESVSRAALLRYLEHERIVVRQWARWALLQQTPDNREAWISEKKLADMLANEHFHSGWLFMDEITHGPHPRYREFVQSVLLNRLRDSDSELVRLHSAQLLCQMGIPEGLNHVRTRLQALDHNDITNINRYHSMLNALTMNGSEEAVTVFLDMLRNADGPAMMRMITVLPIFNLDGSALREAARILLREGRATASSIGQWASSGALGKTGALDEEHEKDRGILLDHVLTVGDARVRTAIVNAIWNNFHDRDEWILRPDLHDRHVFECLNNIRNMEHASEAYTISRGRPPSEWKDIAAYVGGGKPLVCPLHGQSYTRRYPTGGSAGIFNPAAEDNFIVCSNPEHARVRIEKRIRNARRARIRRIGVAVKLHARTRRGALPARWADLADSLAALGEEDMEAIAREWGLTAGLTDADPPRAILVFGKSALPDEPGVYVLLRNGVIEWLPADEWTRTLATPSEFWGTDNADVIGELRKRVRLPWPYDALALWGNMNWSLIWQRYESPDAAVRRETVASLHLIAGDAETDAGKESAFLERAIADADPDVRLAVVARLAALGGDAAARLLPDLLADPDLRVRRQASVAIRNLRDKTP